MTPDQESYRDLWMSECWKPVREWHQTKDERLDVQARNDLLTERRERRGAA
jgi:hypothetical protein